MRKQDQFLGHVVLSLGHGAVPKPMKCKFCLGVKDKINDARGRFHKLVCVLCRCVCSVRPTFEKLFCGVGCRRLAQGAKQFFKSTPGHSIIKMQCLTSTSNINQNLSEHLKICLDQGSNQGPLDLQSNALPTELSRQI